jgi:hypothetical protein
MFGSDMAQKPVKKFAATAGVAGKLLDRLFGNGWHGAHLKKNRKLQYSRGVKN